MIGGLVNKTQKLYTNVNMRATQIIITLALSLLAIGSPVPFSPEENTIEARGNGTENGDGSGSDPDIGRFWPVGL